MSKKVWPTVKEQLDASSVVPGGALDKLIRENQDFHLLRSDERNDKVGLPPWLRVYWRKHHPELIYSAEDPTGGYPRVLNNVYTWMVLNQDLGTTSPVNLEGKAGSSSQSGRSFARKGKGKGRKHGQ